MGYQPECITGLICNLIVFIAVSLSEVDYLTAAKITNIEMNTMKNAMQSKDRFQTETTDPLVTTPCNWRDFFFCCIRPEKRDS
jgi:hypothetical protein